MSISHLVLVMLQALRGNQAFQVLVGLSDGLQWLMYNGHHPESRGRSDPFPSPTHVIRVAQLPPSSSSAIWDHSDAIGPILHS